MTPRWEATTRDRPRGLALGTEPRFDFYCFLVVGDRERRSTDFGFHEVALRLGKSIPHYFLVEGLDCPVQPFEMLSDRRIHWLG